MHFFDNSAEIPNGHQNYSTIAVSVICLQNYNKSRIHSYRGARNIEVILDGQLIFKGEIARACGGITGGSDNFGDVSIYSVY